MPLRKAVIVPGNGSGDVERSNWYGWARKQIDKVNTHRVKHVKTKQQSNICINFTAAQRQSEISKR